MSSVTEFHGFLRAVPGLLDSGDRVEDTRRQFLHLLGYDPENVTTAAEDVTSADDEADPVAPIAEGEPIVDGDLPLARRFVLRVGSDPMDDPPVPSSPDEMVYPVLELIDDELDVDYVVQLTDYRLVLYGENFARTYVLHGDEEDEAVEAKPTFEPLTRDAAEELYTRLAVDAAHADQSSIADY